MTFDSDYKFLRRRAFEFEKKCILIAIGMYFVLDYISDKINLT